MKFFMEKNKDEGHRVRINILKKTVNDAIIKELINIRKKTNINGFRKGKTPISVLQKKYGSVVYYDVFKQLMQKFFYEFIHKEKITIIGSPKYYMHKSENIKKEYFEYSVIYETYPNFDIKDINNIKVKKITVNITDEDVKKNIKKDTIKEKSWKIENKPIKSYDRVTINYSIYQKNKKLENFDRENIRFIVCDNQLIPQLNEKIINHIMNDIIFLKITIHQFYPEPELQNKEIILKIKIVKIEKKQELNSERNSKKHIEKENCNQLNLKNIKNNFIFQINNISQKYLEEQIIKKIIKKNIIEIPPILFQEERKKIYKKYKKEYFEEKNYNILERKYHFNFDLYTKTRLSRQIIIEKIISDNKLCVNEKNIQSLIQKISLNYNKPIEIINLYNRNKNLKNIIKNIELENQAIQILKKNVHTIEQSWTFDQFINHNWNIYEELTI